MSNFLKSLILLLCVLTASLSFAQGSRKDDAAINSSGVPIPNPTVRVCTEAATGIPCSPVASIFTDKTLTVSASNPFNGDAFGNFNFFAAPGWYQVQVSAPGISPYTFKALLAPDVNKVQKLTSATAGAAIGGVLNLAPGDTLCWRNTANTADVCLSKNGSDQIVGVTGATAPFVTNSATPAASGVLRCAAGDTCMCFRNNANTADVCLSLNGSNQIIGASASAPFVTTAANPSTTGVLELATGDVIGWRNNANSANVTLSKNTSDQLVWPNGFGIAGDPVMTRSPIGVWSDDETGNSAAVYDVSRTKFPRAVQIISFHVSLEQSGAGCTTQPQWQLIDNTQANAVISTLTGANGTLDFDSGALSFNVASGDILRTRVSTAAAGCTTNPSSEHFEAFFITN